MHVFLIVPIYLRLPRTSTSTTRGEGSMALWMMRRHLCSVVLHSPGGTACWSAPPPRLLPGRPPRTRRSPPAPGHLRAAAERRAARRATRPRRRALSVQHTSQAPDVPTISNLSSEKNGGTREDFFFWEDSTPAPNSEPVQYFLRAPVRQQAVKCIV